MPSSLAAVLRWSIPALTRDPSPHPSGPSVPFDGWLRGYLQEICAFNPDATAFRDREEEVRARSVARPASPTAIKPQPVRRSMRGRHAA